MGGVKMIFLKLVFKRFSDTAMASLSLEHLKQRLIDTYHYKVIIEDASLLIDLEDTEFIKITVDTSSLSGNWVGRVDDISFKSAEELRNILYGLLGRGCMPGDNPIAPFCLPVD